MESLFLNSSLVMDSLPVSDEQHTYNTVFMQHSGSHQLSSLPYRWQLKLPFGSQVTNFILQITEDVQGAQGAGQFRKNVC